MSSLFRIASIRPRVFVFFLAFAAVFLAATAGLPRTWTSKGGNHAIEAEYVECKDDVVSLRKPNGTVIKVPLNRLSADDQAFVVEQFHKPTETEKKETPAGKNRKRTFSQLVQFANSLPTATEVLRVYEMFLRDEKVSEAERKAAQEQLPVWKDRAAKKMVRIGLRWLTPEEANDQRLQAKILTDEALRLIEVSQFDIAIEKCLKASKIDESSILADYLLAMGHALDRRDAKMANRHFSECVSRDPRHISALNNLALTEIRLQKYSQAIAHWEAAIEVAPPAPEIVHNVGRILHLCEQGRIRLPKGTRRQLADLYATMTVSTRNTGFHEQTLWLYMGYYANNGKKPPESPRRSPTRTICRVAAGHGTGFVVYPEYVLTNRHVVEGTSGLGIIASEKNRELPAEVIAVAEGRTNDLAIVHCKGLVAEPLRFIRDEYARRGTEVMVLGFPGMIDGRDPSLKSTRGILSGLPDASFDAYTLDAICNPGNSGGPVCDATGSVLGVLFAGTRVPRQVNNYTLAVPHSRALPLIKESVPGFEQLPPYTDNKQWPDVDSLVSKSTVNIRCYEAVWEIHIPSKSEAKKKAEQLVRYEDPWCMTCYGRCTVNCRDCQNGTVSVATTQTVYVPALGRNVTYPARTRVSCKTCKGKGQVTCPDCHHGIERWK